MERAILESGFLGGERLENCAVARSLLAWTQMLRQRQRLSSKKTELQMRCGGRLRPSGPALQ